MKLGLERKVDSVYPFLMMSFLKTYQIQLHHTREAG